MNGGVGPSPPTTTTTTTLSARALAFSLTGQQPATTSSSLTTLSTRMVLLAWGGREFVTKQYAALAAANKGVPINVRECSGVEARITGRFGFGREAVVSVAGMSAADVGKALGKLA